MAANGGKENMAAMKLSGVAAKASYRPGYRRKSLIGAAKLAWRLKKKKKSAMRRNGKWHQRNVSSTRKLAAAGEGSAIGVSAAIL